MAERKFTVTLFLLAVFAFLSIFIAMWVYGIFTENSAYVKKTAKSSLQCNDYSFDISGIDYSENTGTLSFDVENPLGGEPFTTLVVEGEDGMKETALSDFDGGVLVHRTISNITIKDSFIAYPKGCKNANRKKYTI